MRRKPPTHIKIAHSEYLPYDFKFCIKKGKHSARDMFRYR